MEKEIRKILYENFGYGDADKATKELLDLFSVSNNEVDLDCDYDLNVKVPFKTKRYKIKVISEVAVCGHCKGEGWVEEAMRTVPCPRCGGNKQTDC